MKLAKLLQLEIEEPKESKFISITDKNSIVTFEGLLNGKVFKVGYNFRGSELKYDWDSKTDSSLDKRDVLEFIANEKLHKNDKIYRRYREDTTHPIEEMSTTGGVAGYQTPMAFSKDKNSIGNVKAATTLGMQIAPKTDRNFKDLSNQKTKSLKDTLGESVFKNEFRKEMLKEQKEMQGKTAINNEIAEMNGIIYKLESNIKRIAKIKQESEIGGSDYWEITKNKVLKMKHRLNKISSLLLQLNA